MPVSNSNTKAEFEAAYVAVHKLRIKLKEVQQGMFPATKLSTAKIAELQTLVNAVETALEPLGQDAS